MVRSRGQPLPSRFRRWWRDYVPTCIVFASDGRHKLHRWICRTERSTSARQQSLAVRLVDSTLQAVVLRTNQVATVMVATARIADAAQTSAMWHRSVGSRTDRPRHIGKRDHVKSVGNVLPVVVKFEEINLKSGKARKVRKTSRSAFNWKTLSTLNVSG